VTFSGTVKYTLGQYSEVHTSTSQSNLLNDSVSSSRLFWAKW